MTEQSTLAERFAALHRRGDPLLLPNAWDAASAVVIAAAGAPAVATTSAGVAWSLGVPDGADLGAERNAAAVGRIAAAVPVPVSADIEAGYGPRPADVAATVTAVLGAGAVGVNLEDVAGPGVLHEPAEQAARIAAAREAADRLGIRLWINARTDLFLAGIGPADERLDAARHRADVYAAAGADSIFVPGLVDPDRVAALAAGPVPVAVMVGPGAPPASAFAAAGAVRISLGAAISQAAYAVARRATVELLKAGTYDEVADGVAYGDLNAALAGPVRSAESG